MNLFKAIMLDWKLNSKISSIILIFYRITNSLYKRNSRVALTLVLCIQKIIFFFFNIDSQISYKCIIGSNIRLLHRGQGVVISSKSNIGNYCTILHQVTIGINEDKDKNEIYIGNYCFIGAGAKIISCNICDNTKIGANAVVVKDIKVPSIVYSVYEVKINKTQA